MPTDPRTAAMEILRLLVVDDDGTRWGDVSEPFQIADAEAVLDIASPTSRYLLTRARGGRKTSDAAGIALAVMLTPGQVPPGSTIYAAAADSDQARLLVDSMREYVGRTPELRGAITLNRYDALAVRTGVRFEVVAADTASAWGLRPSFLICDEIAQWERTPRAQEFWTALDSATGKVKGCRVVLLTSAGDPGHWSNRLIRQHALESNFWSVRETPGPLPWVDKRWLDDQRKRLPDSTFARLHLNEWTQGDDRLATPEDVARCVTLDGSQPALPGRAYVVGVDLGLVNDRTVIAVCHLEVLSQVSYGQHDLDAAEVEGRRVVVDHLIVLQGTKKNPLAINTVEREIHNVLAVYGLKSKVVADPWQFEGVLQALKRSGVRAEAFHFGSTSVARLAITMLRLIRSGALAIPDDPELVSEILNIRMRETSPNVHRMDHDPGAHDDRVISIALAALELLTSQRAMRSNVIARDERGRGRR